MSLTASIIIVYGGFYMFIVFLSLSIACGLYYIAELMEEYPLSTKRLLTHAIKAELLIHLVLFIDKLPFHCLALGIISPLLYTPLLRKFPYINLTSPEALSSFGLTLVSSFFWLRHYWSTYYTVEYIVAFMLATTWALPAAFFLSMAGDQSILPGAGGFPYNNNNNNNNSFSSLSSSPQKNGLESSNSGGSIGGSGKQRRGLALRIFDLLRKKRDEVIPEMIRGHASVALLKEKI